MFKKSSIEYENLFLYLLLIWISCPYFTFNNSTVNRQSFNAYRLGRSYMSYTGRHTATTVRGGNEQWEEGNWMQKYIGRYNERYINIEHGLNNSKCEVHVRRIKRT